MPDLLNDRYELGEIVGSGGMGAVHRAIDTRLGRTVAVKVLRDEPLADDTARTRMRSEAKLAASIHHRGVAQVFDFAEVTPAGPTYLVMEFIEGHSLAQLLRQNGPMPADQVMSVVVQVAQGLQACHAAGVVHRDLKPANIMLTPAGRTVLVDFGIARSATSEPLTNTGILIGTADYMSPEQAGGRPATPQSDLYALGLVAYHCLTGTSPFRRESTIATALAQLNDELPAFGPDVPVEVAALVSDLTAKDPATRPASAAAVALRAAGVGAAGAIDLPPTFELPAPTQTTPSPSGRRRHPMVAYAGIGTVALALALLGVQRFDSGDEPVVPGVVGMSAADAKAEIRDAGLTVSARSVDRAGEDAGRVVEQSPAKGSPGPDDGPVRIVVASGMVTVSADDLIGQSYDAASAALGRLGLEVVRTEISRSTKVGEVVALDKSGRLPNDSTITLSVAVAPAAAPAPSAVPTQSTASPGSVTGSGNGTSSGAAKAKGKASGKNNGKAKGKK